MKEIWKDIKGYESYYKVSNLGRVKSFHHKKNSGKIMKKRLDRYGYEIIKLRINGIQKTKTVHRLIALAFIPNPENKKEVNHINGVKNDNSLKNLEWVTSKENVKHYIEHLGGYEKLKNKFYSLTPVDMFSKNGEFIRTFKGQKYAVLWLKSKGFVKATGSNISMCCNNQLQSAYGYIWKYSERRNI